MRDNERQISFADGTKEIAPNIIRETLSKEHLRIDRIEFPNKKDALNFRFAYSGANVGPATLVYEGEPFKKSYILNMAYHKDRSNRAEFSFVCANVRYLITSACPDYVKDIDVADDQNVTYRAYGTEMIEAVKEAERIVMLLK